MKKVLVLEDESSIRSFIVINLRRAGYEVVEAETGEEALEKLKEHTDVRVALLDIMLPGIDGFEVCRRIRATNATIGIIMLTARTQEMDKVTGFMTGADDYASMREVVFRRYTRLMAEGAEMPDLIIADGGKGQMGVIHEVLERLGLDIPIAGLAKDDRHRTAELLCGFPPVLVGIRPTSPLFHFLAHIQEEVHRFAVSFHRQKRSKAFIHSELEQIEGVGDKTVQTLLRHFRTVEKVRAANIEELSALVGAAKAKKIRAFFEK